MEIEDAPDFDSSDILEHSAAALEVVLEAGHDLAIKMQEMSLGQAYAEILGLHRKLNYIVGHLKVKSGNI